MKLCEYLNSLAEISVINLMTIIQKKIEVWTTTVESLPLSLYYFSIYSTNIGLDMHIDLTMMAKKMKSKYAYLSIYRVIKSEKKSFNLVYFNIKDLDIINTATIIYGVVRS